MGLVRSVIWTPLRVTGQYEFVRTKCEAKPFEQELLFTIFKQGLRFRTPAIESYSAKA